MDHERLEVTSLTDKWYDNRYFPHVRPARRWALVALLLALCLISVSPGGGVLAADPPYADVDRSYWAYQYIDVLREEAVTDGYLFYRWISGRWVPEYRFWPTANITRAEYVLMLAKVFRLAPVSQPAQFFADVPPSLLLYGRIPALPWVEAARLAGIALGTPDHLFHPADALRRDAAVALLIRSLGLAQFAASLTDDEVSRLLGRFYDSYNVNPSLRREVALAVKLQIVLGYPDGSLRPMKETLRAEAATLIYRSSLFVLTAQPNPFSPDGDGVADQTAFATLTLKNRNVTAWNAFVGTLSGAVFRSFHPSLAGAPPAGFSWDGRDDQGRPLPPGTYYYWGWLQDRQGNRYDAVKKPIVLQVRRLTGFLSPTAVQPGDSVLVGASTTGGARSVTATCPNGPTLPMRPASPPPTDTNNWWLTCQVPTSAALGATPVVLEADFGDSTRRLVLYLDITEVIELSGQLAPNPARPGAGVMADASTSLNVQRVTVSWPWGGVQELTSRGGGSWWGRADLPPALPAGKYQVTFTAYGRYRTRTAVVDLTVLANPLEDVRFVLTD